MTESRSVMDSTGYNLKKVVHNDASADASSGDNDSECSGSVKMGFIPTKEDKEPGITSNSDEEEETSDKEEAVVMQMLKEEKDREKEAEDPDYSNTYSISDTEEEIQQASQTEGKDFRVLQNKRNSQRPGEELLLAYSHVCGFYCSILLFGSFVIN